MNNYDKSSSGINIDLVACYVGDAARGNWGENFAELEGLGYWYTAYNQVPVPTELRDFITIKPQSIGQLIEDLNGIGDSWYENEDFEDLDSAISEVFLSYSHLGDLQDLIKILVTSGIPYTKRYIKIVTKGCSQGDIHDVYYNPTKLRELWGTPISYSDESLLESGYVDNLFWDYPMFVRITINDEEFYSEKFDGQYEQWNKLGWCKETFIEECLTHYTELNKKVLKEQLGIVVPDELEYED
jgi:hypothetical protein